MTETNTASEQQPGLVLGVVSCVCAVLAFFIPVLGLILAIVALVCGIKGYKAAKAVHYQNGTILGLVGSLIGGISLLFAAISVIALLGMAGGIGMMGALS
ncbi:MAG: hypothetical protein COB76_00975 [Alphaproteobacteria bacterium]|nr:MAG: hypothetical protein COB76_00975 [Alphaproteobacteria bacterium]